VYFLRARFLAFLLCSGETGILNRIGSSGKPDTLRKVSVSNIYLFPFPFVDCTTTPPPQRGRKLQSKRNTGF